MTKTFKVIRERLPEEVGDSVLAPAGTPGPSPYELNLFHRLRGARQELQTCIKLAREYLAQDQALSPLIVDALTLRRGLENGKPLLISGRLVVDDQGYVCLEGEIPDDSKGFLKQCDTPKTYVSPAAPPQPPKEKPPAETPEEPPEQEAQSKPEPEVAPQVEIDIPGERLTDYDEKRLALVAQAKELGVPYSDIRRNTTKLTARIREHLEAQSQIAPDSTEVSETEPPKLPPHLAETFLEQTKQADTALATTGAAAAAKGMGEVMHNATGGSSEDEENTCEECGEDLGNVGDAYTWNDGLADYKLCLKCYRAKPDPEDEDDEEEEPEEQPPPPPKKKMIRTSPALSVTHKDGADVKIDPADTSDNDNVISMLGAAGNSVAVTGDEDDDENLDSLLDEIDDDDGMPSEYPPPGSAGSIKEITAQADGVDIDALLAPEEDDSPLEE